MRVPGSIFQVQGLSATAKAIWLASLWVEHELTPAALAAASGVTLPTVRRGLAELSAAGWRPGERPTQPATVEMPTALLSARRVGAQAKLLYGLLQLVPSFGRREFSITYKALGRFAQIRHGTLKAALDELANAGWLRMRLTRQRADNVAHFVLLDPEYYRQRLHLVRAKRRLQRAKFKGEALMREWLSVLVSTELFADEASPGYLINPQTGEQLRFDRFYPPTVAWEFNGPQHYGATDWFPGDEKAREQQLRDMVKAGICYYKGITLVVVHTEDLSLDGMRRKIGTTLPLRDLSGPDRGGYRMLMDYLQQRCRQYQQNAAADLM
ncbi:MAG TPA: hypothetical protein VD973_28605 [Symbiobacteriaceae bacterium]|nr:hypothetical protein [Symbiobacteriaceae bacterium]